MELEWPSEDAQSEANQGSDAPESSAQIGLDSRHFMRRSMLGLVVVLCAAAAQAPFEVLNTRDKGCSHLIAFTEHVFAIFASLGALHGPVRLPWYLHLVAGLLDAGYSVFLSMALSTPIPVGAMIAMKNGNLIVSVVLEACVLRRRYSYRQLLAVLLVTLGIVTTSLSLRGSPKTAIDQGQVSISPSILMGLAYLTLALVCRAFGSLLQEQACRQYNATAAEQVLYRSLLGLPLLLLRWPDIVVHATKWSVEDAIGGLPWFSLWLLLCLQCASDLGTKVTITWLIQETSALTATFAITFQRFLSFVLSALFLATSQVDLYVCLGTACTLGGTLTYACSSAGAAKSTSAVRISNHKDD